LIPEFEWVSVPIKSPAPSNPKESDYCIPKALPDNRKAFYLRIGRERISELSFLLQFLIRFSARVGLGLEDIIVEIIDRGGGKHVRAFLTFHDGLIRLV